MKSTEVLIECKDVMTEATGKAFIDNDASTNIQLHNQHSKAVLSTDCTDLMASDDSKNFTNTDHQITKLIDEDSLSGKVSNGDSEISGNNFTATDNDNRNNSNNTGNNLRNKSNNRSRVLIDSDSEDDLVNSKIKNNLSTSVHATDDEIDNEKNFKPKRRMRIISDSENEDNTKEENQNDREDNSDDEEMFEDEKVGGKNIVKKKFSTLIDSESEDESCINNSRIDNSVLENYNNNSDDKESDTEDNKKKSRSTKREKKKTGSKRAAKDEAMKQIHSETQRLMRESSVSLPYHKPKQRSLEEFLNRKKIALDLPQASTTIARMKMSAALVNEVLKEKEKEAELFYKSDSEDDDDETVNETKSTESKDENNIEVEKNQQEAKSAASRRLFQNDLNDSKLKIDVPMETDPGKSFEKNKIFTTNINSVPFINEYQSGAENQEKCDLEHDNNLDKKLENDNGQVKVHKNGENSSKENLYSNIKDVDVWPLKSNNLLPDDEFTQMQVVTDKEIEKLIDEESKMDYHESSSQASNDSDTELKKIENSAAINGHVLGLPLPEFDSPEIMLDTPKFPVPAVKTKKNILLNVPNIKPMLKGLPGMVIDLTSSSKPNSEAINSLVDRFLTKHSTVNKHTKSNNEVTVLATEATPEGLKVVKDVLSYKQPVAEHEDPELSKPGAKLARLKEDLKKRMASKRTEEWKHREQESGEQEDEDEEFNEKKSKCLNEDSDGNDDDDDNDDDEEGESEPEEDDIIIKESKRKHCEFGDDEAEVSEDENVELSDDEREEEEDDKNEVSEDVEDKEDDDDDDDEEKEEEEDKDENETNKNNMQKKFNRIVAMDEDDDTNDIDEKVEIIDDDIKTLKSIFQRTQTDIDIFDDDDDNDDDIPPYQPQQNNTQENSPIYKTPLTPSHPQSLHSRLNMFTSSSARSIATDSPPKSIPSLMNSWDIDSSQTQRNDSQRKLFESQDKAVTDEELMTLCSGKFTESSQINDSTPKLTSLFNTECDVISDSQIMGLCSGNFETQTPGLQSTKCNDETSQDFCLTLDDNSQNSWNGNNLAKKAKGIEIKVPLWQSLDMLSSSEDENIEMSNNDENNSKIKMLKKKKVKQLVLSDDEEDGDQVNSYDEEEEDDDENIGSEDEEEKFIDYDSDENEIVVVPKKEIKNVAANFLEAEAELSESEWGSEDEDEKDLDKLELEVADDEEIDEDEMRDQLGKMHARQVLDDDQRDIRMLKELLFEDGDLHTDSAGRERKFKWKNIDKLTEESLLRPMDTDVDDDNQVDPNDVTSEMEWRKLRLEREKFLEEKIKSADDDLLNEEIASGGQLFKLGMKVLKKKKNSIEQSNLEISSNKPIIPRTVSELMGTPEGEKSKLLHNAMKRGSFLARGDEALARLAVVIKQTDNVVLAPKHSKNFLFTHLSPSVHDANEECNQKETNDEENVDNKTRKRKIIAGITPRTVKKAKTEGNRSGKKLF